MDISQRKFLAFRFRDEKTDDDHDDQRKNLAVQLKIS